MSIAFDDRRAVGATGVDADGGTGAGAGVGIDAGAGAGGGAETIGGDSGWGAGGGDAGGVAGGIGGTYAGIVSSDGSEVTTIAPQRGQKFAPSGMAVPHCAQKRSLTRRERGRKCAAYRRSRLMSWIWPV